MTTATLPTTHASHLFIDLNAIASNVATLQNHAPATQLMAMVKANAYGTDALTICHFLETCGLAHFGVANIHEAVPLRKGGITSDLLLLNIHPHDAATICQYRCTPAISSLSLARSLSEEAQRHGIILPVHLDIDTGMTRLGCMPQDATDLAKEVSTLPFIHLEGAMTHFPAADDPNHDHFTLKQVETFLDSIHAIETAGIPLRWKHAANASALIRFSFPQLNMARVGLALYGMYASTSCSSTLPLKLALSLKTTLCAIHNCPKGTTVSYGRTFKVDTENKKIGVIPVGYYDGIHRNYSNKGYVLIKGQRAPIIGTVCMDFTMIDITHIANIEIGDTVTIFGSEEGDHQLTPEEFAAFGNTISHELTTCIGPRVQRIFKR
ncbi:MAG: alanine racemase [Chlamydiales bacterium]|nr:alanine racemase [Chlamydiia bacterium]MCP5508447.1 alanine racemase [Chlamydiales bacterium]